jgi:hypothetical protein
LSILRSNGKELDCLCKTSPLRITST